MVAAKVKQGREKQIKEVISGNALQRLAKHLKSVVFAHTKRSLEKLVKHLPSPVQKKGNETFSIETSLSNNKGNILVGSRERFHGKNNVFILPP